MAITALATENTIIGPAQFADMTSILQAPFVCDGPSDFAVTQNGNGSVTVAAGAAHAGGTRVRSTSPVTVTIPVPNSGQMWYAIVLRINWASPTPQIIAVPGTSSTIVTNSAGGFDQNKVNRQPGVAYDALIAIARMTAGSAVPATLTDLRMWGGDGGPFIVTSGGLANSSMFDARPGTWINTDRAEFTKRKDNDGVWRDVGAASNPWKEWTPTLRFNGNSAINGTSGGTPVNLGTGGRYSGRYRVVDGMLDAFIQITTAAGNQFGTGPITVDLPLPCSAWQADTWSNGHIFTSTDNGGDRNLDWASQILVKAGWTRGLIFAPVSGDYSNLEAHRSSRDGGSGQGVPFVAGGWSVGAVYTMNMTYPVG